MTDADRIVQSKKEMQKAIMALRLEVPAEIADDVGRRFESFCEIVSNVIDPVVFAGGGKLPIPWCKCPPGDHVAFLACQTCMRPLEPPK